MYIYKYLYVLFNFMQKKYFYIYLNTIYEWKE